MWIGVDLLTVTTPEANNGRVTPGRVLLFDLHTKITDVISFLVMREAFSHPHTQTLHSNRNYFVSSTTMSQKDAFLLPSLYLIGSHGVLESVPAATGQEAGIQAGQNTYLQIHI